MKTAPEISTAKKITTDTDSVIEVKNLSISFGSNHVLQDFTLELKRGENLVVLGKSGSGKSVLIKCIIGLLKPDAGDVLVFGEDVSEMDHHQLDRMRSRVGFLFQSNALYDSMTVRQNLEFPLRRHWIDIDQNEANDRVLSALDDVGLAHTVDMMPIELSGGMRKRIALARTLILRPEIILYDEPTTGLDPITGKEISRLMVEIGEKYQASSLIITHDMKCVEATADRIIVLYKGRCHLSGTLKELKKSTDPFVQSFFN